MTEDAPKKFNWGAVVRGAVGVGILVWVFSRIPLRDLWGRLANISLADVAVLVVLGILQMVVAAGRWWRLFARLGERLPFSAVQRDLLVGMFFNIILPTSFGGDVIRALRAGRRIQTPYHAWSSSLFERLLGMLALAVVGAIGALLALGEALPVAQRAFVVALALALVLAMFFVSAPIRVLIRILEKRLPARFITNIQGAIADLEGPLATKGARLETLAWSMLGTGLNIVYAWYCAKALGANGHGVAILVGLPVISVLTLAPVSLGGHGLREGLFVVVLGLLGVPKDVALGLALLALAYNLTFALLGGVVALVEPIKAAPERSEPASPPASGA